MAAVAVFATCLACSSSGGGWSDAPFQVGDDGMYCPSIREPDFGIRVSLKAAGGDCNPAFTTIGWIARQCASGVCGEDGK